MRWRIVVEVEVVAPLQGDREWVGGLRMCVE